MALRLSGQLLLGVVRVYIRKLQFLETDARSAVENLQRNNANSQILDLPDGGTAPEAAITLPDTDIALAQADLFPNFDGVDLFSFGNAFNQNFSATKESLTMAQDISEVFGSRWTGEDQMNVELEILRSHAAEMPRSAGRDLFFEPSSGDVPPIEDMVMEAPPEDLFPLPTGATPGSGGPGPGLSDPGGLSQASLGAAPYAEDILPDIGGTILSGGFMDDGPGISMSIGGGSTGGGAVGEDVTGKIKLAQRRRRPTVDVNAAGKAAIQLPHAEIKKLLDDRTPLMKPRGLAARRSSADKVHHPKPLDIEAELAKLDPFFHPVGYEALGPDLLDILKGSLTLPDGTAAFPGEEKKSRNLREEEPEVVEVDEDAAGDDFDGPAMSDGFTAGDWPADDGDGFTQQVDLFGGADEEPISADKQPLELKRVRASGEDNDDVLIEGSLGGSETSGDQAVDGFTARTRLVLSHLQKKFAPVPGKKRRNPVTGGGEPDAELGLHSLLEGKERLDASRWFYQMLVLRGQGWIDMCQEEAYGDIVIKPRDKLMLEIES